MPPLPSAGRAALAIGAACAALYGCQSAGQALLTLMPGVTNDPQNRTLRRELMGMGSGQFCGELTKRGAALKLRDEQPAIGRFYAQACDYKELPNGDAFVQFGGFGYGWMQPTDRIGFEAAGAIQYNPDFLLDGSTMYAYFRPRSVQSTNFLTKKIGRELVAGPLGAIITGSVGDLANRLGSQMVSQELQKGFTVIRDKSGAVDFGLGIVEKGQRPFHPFDVRGSDKVTLADDISEVHGEQREFVGPLEIDGDKRALYLTMNLDGVPAIDVIVLRKDMGDVWLKQYIYVGGTSPLPGAAAAGDVLPAGAAWKRAYPLPKGLYYVVLDNTSTAGNVAPPPGTPGVLGTSDTPATVRYVAQLGDAP